MSEAVVAKGHKVIPYRMPERLLDLFIQLGVDLRCHCTNKYQHKCPLFVALSTLGIRKEEELFLSKNGLIQKLVMNGATLKKHWNDPRTYSIPWFDVEQVKSYLLLQ